MFHEHPADEKICRLVRTLITRPSVNALDDANAIRHGARCPEEESSALGTDGA